MATYGLKYLCEYRSDLRGRLLYRIEIEERDAVAATDETAIKMRPHSDVFSIKWGNADDPEYTAVKGSSMTLKILCVNDMEYLPLFTVDPQKYRVTIYEYRNNASGDPVKLMLWRGFLLANNYKEEFARPPYVVTLSATDGFALLGSMPFRSTSGSRYSERISISELLAECVARLGLELPVADWIYMDDTSVGERTLGDVYIDRGRIYNVKDDATWRDVLEFCLKPFVGQIFQTGGTIHIRRIGSLRGESRPASYSANERLIGKTRPLCLRLWADRCDIRSSSELELCGPYRKAVVSVENTQASDSNGVYYSKSSWVDKVNIGNSFHLGNRVVIAGVTVGKISLALPQIFEPANAANIDISLQLSNLMTGTRVEGEIAVIAKVGNVNMKWNPESKSWATDTGKFDYNYSVEPKGGTDPTWGYRVSIYTPASRLGSYNFQTQVTNLPQKNDNDDYRLFIRVILQPADLNVESRSVILISDIRVSTSSADSKSDVNSITVPISSISADNCEISTPLRDGGYHLNMKAILACPITDENDIPIVSWLTASERGDLLHMAGSGLLRLRSVVRRQIAGELRSPDSVDLNSLFTDGKFTNAVYYVNSLELLASRQIYKVQLRELLDLNRILPVGKLSRVHTFSERVKLACSLHGTLFFRTGSGPYGVKMYNSETGAITVLPYNATRIDVRKGLGAVVVQSGDSDLYALNNVGEVLSHLDAQTKDVLNHATALYDADRKSWVSYSVNSAGTKTTITIFTDNLELESQDEFAIVANGINLISNGYVVRSGTFATYWHNYELHPYDMLLPVTDANNPMSGSQFDTMDVSDCLLVKRYMSGRYVVAEVCRRSGNKFRADKRFYTFGSYGSTSVTAKCNCAIAASILYYSDRSELEIYDARDGRKFNTPIASNAEIAVCGPHVFTLADDKLSCFPLEKLAPYREGITRVNILCADFKGRNVNFNIRIPGLGLSGNIDVQFSQIGMATIAPDAVLAAIGGTAPLSGYFGHALTADFENYSGRRVIPDSGIIAIMLTKIM